ncbi:hypothetical protein PR202_gb16090 [Eleusine coracana subsp. coracana]|uniref:Secreted protein n=1 Tax=Eleusine coracana subsp. coracana TaxID=191504 RepID=A0AAV5EZI8_ELECO|nr:hypothetical protein PR202_gb16090 [Eleusine coracana subsp. coracana]
MPFLPSAKAVRTCVLTCDWHYLWKSVPALRVTDGRACGDAYALNKFRQTPCCASAAADRLSSRSTSNLFRPQTLARY